MDRQQLFDLTVSRLDRMVVHDFGAYEALESSGLVRKLLIDESPLLHQVNRQRRRRVRFDVWSNPALEAEIMEDGPVFWTSGDGLSPRLAPTAGQVESMTLDRFLSHRAMFVKGHTVTVKDVVTQLANVEGGVHAGTPHTEVEKALHEVNKALGIGGMGSVAYSMRGIVDVVAVALMPLALHPS